MRTTKLLISLLAIIFTPGIATGADKSGRYNIMGQGTVSCGTVVSEFDIDDSGKLAQIAWIQGYLSAINQEVYPGKDVAANTDAESRQLWIYNYCKTNPLDTLHAATRALIREFKLRNR